MIPTGDLLGIISVLAKPWYSPARDFGAPIVRGTTRARGASGIMVRARCMTASALRLTQLAECLLVDHQFAP